MSPRKMMPEPDVPFRVGVPGAGGASAQHSKPLVHTFPVRAACSNMALPRVSFRVRVRVSVRVMVIVRVRVRVIVRVRVRVRVIREKVCLPEYRHYGP